MGKRVVVVTLDGSLNGMTDEKLRHRGPSAGRVGPPVRPNTMTNRTPPTDEELAEMKTRWDRACNIALDYRQAGTSVLRASFSDIPRLIADLQTERAETERLRAELGKQAIGDQKLDEPDPFSNEHWSAEFPT